MMKEKNSSRLSTMVDFRSTFISAHAKLGSGQQITMARKMAQSPFSGVNGSISMKRFHNNDDSVVVEKPEVHSEENNIHNSIC